MNHKLDFCNHCGVYMFRCGTCDNNSCNGGFGTINGEKCKDCPEAYELDFNLKLNLFQKFREWIYHTKLRTSFYHLKHSYFFRRICGLFCNKYLK
jgi:hypothetical protein